MSILAQKQLAFLEETVNHYNSNNRCSSQQICKYSPATLKLEGVSEGCAIGRKLDPELAKQLDEDFGGSMVDERQVYSRLPENLSELGSLFLRFIQVLHDNDENWDDEGLTMEGKKRVEKIKLRFEL